jgi:hypothetical protein
MSTSTRAISSSGGISDISSISQSVDYHEIYERILPYVRDTEIQTRSRENRNRHFSHC